MKLACIVTEQTGFGKVYVRHITDMQFGGATQRYGIYSTIVRTDMRINGKPFSRRPGTYEAIGCWSFREDVKR
jgi:hypothetical protein